MTLDLSSIVLPDQESHVTHNTVDTDYTRPARLYDSGKSCQSRSTDLAGEEGHEEGAAVARLLTVHHRHLGGVVGLERDDLRVGRVCTALDQCGPVHGAAQSRVLDVQLRDERAGRVRSGEGR